MSRERILPLELAFRVAELGGWLNVELLSYASIHVYDCDQPTWIRVGAATSKEQIALYLHPEPGMGWHVYDVRKKQ